MDQQIKAHTICAAGITPNPVAYSPNAVTRIYRRDRSGEWFEHVCTEDNHHVVIGRESYFLDAAGTLMPTRRDQPAPDLRYFQSRK